MPKIIWICAMYTECRTMGWRGVHEFPGLVYGWLDQVTRLTQPTTEFPKVGTLCGRVTFEKMGRYCFIDRTNFVISTTLGISENTVVYSNLTEVFEAAKDLDVLYVFGGYSTLKSITKLVDPDTIYLFKIYGRAKKQGLRFPEIDEREYHTCTISEHEGAITLSQPNYTLCRLDRAQASLF